MLYCYDIDDRWVHCVDSKTLKRHRLSYEELFDMFMSGDYVYGLDTRYRYQHVILDLKALPAELEVTGFVCDIVDTFYEVTSYNLKRKGVRFDEENRVVTELRPVTKVPIRQQMFRKRDISTIMNDIIIKHIGNNYFIWYNDMYTCVKFDELNTIYYDNDNKIIIDLGYHLSLPLEKYMMSKGMEMSRSEFMRTALFL